MADEPEIRLRVMSYNIHGLRDDAAAVVRVVRDLAPDVLLLQEAGWRFRWRTRIATLAHSFGMVVAAGGLPAMGNVIMTNMRVDVHGTWSRRYPLTPGRHLRGAAFARCSVRGVPFLVAGSHLSTDPAERPGQAGLLRRAMAGAVPVIFGGDLNDVPGGAAWRLVADGLADAAVGDGPPTFPARDPRSRIDVIFVDPRFAVVGHQVPSGPAARVGSDHLPVVADIRLPADPVS